MAITDLLKLTFSIIYSIMNLYVYGLGELYPICHTESGNITVYAGENGARGRQFDGSQWFAGAENC